MEKMKQKETRKSAQGKDKNLSISIKYFRISLLYLKSVRRFIIRYEDKTKQNPKKLMTNGWE